jgi:hypothetical protein
MASTEKVMDCVVERLGAPPSIFTEFLDKFHREFNLDLLSTENSKILLVYSFRYTISIYINNIETINTETYKLLNKTDFILGLHVVTGPNKIQRRLDNDYIINVEAPKHSIFLNHFTCWLSNFLTNKTIDTIGFNSTGESHPDPIKILSKLLLVTPNQVNLVLDYDHNPVILDNLDLTHFTTFRLSDNILTTFNRYKDRFINLKNIKVEKHSPDVTIHELIQRSLDTDIENAHIIIYDFSQTNKQQANNILTDLEVNHVIAKFKVSVTGNILNIKFSKDLWSRDIGLKY